MKYFLASIATALVLLANAGTVGAYSELFVFGDSVSDSGNAAIIADTFAGGFDYSSYPNGQFTNGDSWATQLGLAPSFLGGTNYAVGGARAVENGDILPDLAAQIDSFEAASHILGDSAIAVIQIGGNDFRDFSAAGDFSPEAIGAFATGLVTEFTIAVGDLASAGFSEIFVASLPPLGDIPGVVGTAAGAFVSGVVDDFNAALSGTLMTLNAWYTGVEIAFVDFNAVFEQAAGEGNPLGFENWTQSCLAAGDDCDPDTWLFWDDLHPTEAFHTALAASFTEQVSPVPLPAGFPLLLAGLAAFGVVSWRRKSLA
jgi:phospholipase/lecithinase/hemolysin